MTPRSYWYEFYTEYCPLCGREDTYKVRVYDRPKPAEYEKRHQWKEMWDYCDVF